jgi:hypothetical protein
VDWWLDSKARDGTPFHDEVVDHQVRRLGSQRGSERL